jgi:hypothetical protein
MSADLLTFLQGESRGPKRDMIARCYYEVAQGDPKSGPVAYAVLLDACAECFATVPKEMREANEYFRLLLGQAREFESKLLARIQEHNERLMAEFKEEVAQTTTSLRAAKDIHQDIAGRSRETVSAIREVNEQVRSLSGDLYSLKLELQRYKGCTEQTAETAKGIAQTHEVTKQIVKDVTDTASIHWMSIGVGIGFILALIAVKFPWLGLSLLALAIGFLQWMARELWHSVQKQATKINEDSNKK